MSSVRQPEKLPDNILQYHSVNSRGGVVRIYTEEPRIPILSCATMQPQIKRTAGASEKFRQTETIIGIALMVLDADLVGTLFRAQKERSPGLAGPF